MPHGLNVDEVPERELRKHLVELRHPNLIELCNILLWLAFEAQFAEQPNPPPSDLAIDVDNGLCPRLIVDVNARN